jgi:protein SCO1/2
MRRTDLPAVVDDKSPRLRVSRRSFFQSFAATSLLIGSEIGRAETFTTPNGDHGRIKPPAPVPDVQLLRHDGVKASLPQLTLGHATAVQLMFTACSTTCPIQAAIFERVQTLLPTMAAKGIQLLSLSVNPEDDSVRSLAGWRSRFNAGPQWIAATPSVADTPAIQSFFGRARTNFADHSTQVNIVDRQGRLVWRTNELPASQEIATILSKL